MDVASYDHTRKGRAHRPNIEIHLLLMFGSRLPRLELDHRQTAVRRAHETVHGAANADPGLLGWEERKWDFEVALSGCQQGC